MQQLNLFSHLLTQKMKRNRFELKQLVSLRKDLPPVHYYIFKDYPDKNLTTFVTYGLSAMSHPNWHFGRPELILSVDSTNEAWGIALATLVNRFRGEKLFSNGSTYMLDMPIVSDSKMNGFVIFVPSFLSQDEAVFQLPDKTVFLSQAYPIYPGEGLMIEKLGFESFWSNKHFKDPYDVHRKDVSDLYLK